MPAHPSVSKVLRVVLRYTRGEDIDVINGFFIRYGGTAPSDSDLSLFNIAVGDAWATHLADFHGTNISLTQVESTDLSSPTSSQSTDEVSHAGTLTGSVLTAGVAFVLQLKIARRYRGGHPRLYLPAGDVSKLQDVQTWNATFALNLATAWAAFQLENAGNVWSGGGSLDPVNVSYFQGFTNHTFPSGRVRPIPNPRSTPLVDLITAYVANPKVASQRRRNLQGV